MFKFAGALPRIAADHRPVRVKFKAKGFEKVMISVFITYVCKRSFEDAAAESVVNPDA